MDRRLKAMFSIGCVLTSALLIGLWVRSYWWADDFVVRRPGSRVLIIHSMQGAMAWYGGADTLLDGYWTLTSEPVELLTEGLTPRAPLECLLDFDVIRGGVVIPHWPFLAVAAMLAAVPWVLWRFNLRTMFITTTVAAALLGAIVYAIR